MLLIKNGYIKPMTGPDIENGDVLIGDDGKIMPFIKRLLFSDLQGFKLFRYSQRPEKDFRFFIIFH